MDTETAVRRWIDAWKSAWPAEDVERIASAYADGPLYSSHPFRDPETARSYVERAFGEEKLVSCWFGEPVVDIFNSEFVDRRRVVALDQEVHRSVNRRVRLADFAAGFVRQGRIA